MFRKLYRKIISSVLTVLVLIYLVFDELIWERIAEPIYEFIHNLKFLHKLEQGIVSLNRYAILVLFLILFVAVELLGVVAFGLFAQGLLVPGILLYAGKIPIAAFTFWVFRIAQDKLLTFAWFKYCYELLLSVLHHIKTSAVYLNIKAKMQSIKRWFKSFEVGRIWRRLKSVLRFR